MALVPFPCAERPERRYLLLGFTALLRYGMKCLVAGAALPKRAPRTRATHSRGSAASGFPTAGIARAPPLRRGAHVQRCSGAARSPALQRQAHTPHALATVSLFKQTFIWQAYFGGCWRFGASHQALLSSGRHCARLSEARLAKVLHSSGRHTLLTLRLQFRFSANFHLASMFRGVLALHSALRTKPCFPAAGTPRAFQRHAKSKSCPLGGGQQRYAPWRLRWRLRSCPATPLHQRLLRAPSQRPRSALKSRDATRAFPTRTPAAQPFSGHSGGNLVRLRRLRRRAST